MNNPILEMLNSNVRPTSNQLTPQQKAQFKQMIQNFKGLQNPEQLILQNPNLQQALSLIKAVGNPQQVLMQLASQKGFTMEEIKDIFS